ncbi:ABC transporter ATP-binding protein [Desulfovulcanus sp.]
MLRVRNLKFSYKHQEILKDISLEACPGEILAIIGPNGAGKTTLLRCILHILRPAQGSITIDEQDILAMSSRERAKLLAYVPQVYPSKFPMTVFDVVLMGRRPYLSWRPTKEDLKKVTSILEIMGLVSLSAKDFDCLSGGQKQKVMLARALVQEARYLLLDEPTSSLDLRYQLEVMELLCQIKREKNMSIVVAIHDLNLALRFSDRVVMMHNGTVFCSGASDDVLKQENIRSVYGVNVKVFHNNGYNYLFPVSALKEDYK